MKVDPIIRGGLRRFTDMIGQLWCSLADYYIRAGHFEKVWAPHTPSHPHTLTQARDIYEEAIQTVTTVRDFSQVFDAYVQFEESMINAKMETVADMGPSDDGGLAEPQRGCGQAVSHSHSTDDLDLELRLARFEELMDRRPFLLSR